MQSMKSVEFLGDSLERIREFPKEPRREAGFQLDRVQRGMDPTDWKPMSSVGAGAQEIRLLDESGAYRVIYVAKLADAVYVLHAFKKTTPRTSSNDVRLARQRFAQLIRSKSSRR